MRQNSTDCQNQSKYPATLNQLGVLVVRKISMTVCKSLRPAYYLINM
jgi:hypothetical protein